MSRDTCKPRPPSKLNPSVTETPEKHPAPTDTQSFFFFFFFSFFIFYNLNVSHENVTYVIEFEEVEECGLLQLKITPSLGHDFQQ